MSELTVEAHVTGVTGNDLNRIREQLDTMEGVQLHHAEDTRIILTYEQDVVAATEIQSIIEKAGGEVITMKPRG